MLSGWKQVQNFLPWRWRQQVPPITTTKTNFWCTFFFIKWPFYLDCLDLKDLQSFGKPYSACPTTRHHAHCLCFRTITEMTVCKFLWRHPIKAYSGKEAWKAIRDRLRRPYYLSRVEHVRKIRDRRQRKDIGKYSFVNKTIKNWSQLPAEVLGTFPCKPKIFRHRVRKANINRGEMEGIEVRWKSSKSAGKWSEVKWGEMER